MRLRNWERRESERKSELERHRGGQRRKEWKKEREREWNGEIESKDGDT